MLFLCRCRIRCRRRSDRFKIIQVMGNAVAETAFRELGKHCGGVRGPVAALALGHHLVFCLMAGCTAQGLVLEGAGGKQFICFFVAACTVL